MRQFTINANDGGQRLDKFISKTVRGMPSSLLYKYLRLKKIKVNGRKAEGSQILSEGDVVTMYVSEEFFEASGDATSELGRVKPNLKVVYEDDNLLICDKAPGVLTHAGDEKEANSSESSERETLIFRVKAYLYQKGIYDPSSENSFAPALCNRIDRNTGGLVIAAKNAQTLRDVNRFIRDDMVEKRYLCVVHGEMVPSSDTLYGYLRKNAETKTVQIFKKHMPGSKRIVTEYSQIAYQKQRDLALLDVHLVTGRTHQIRAHLASVGHPLYGEGKYGQNREDRQAGYAHQALYAYSLEFHLPEEERLSYLNGKRFLVDPKRIRFMSLFPRVTVF